MYLEFLLKKIVELLYKVESFCSFVSDHVRQPFNFHDPNQFKLTQVLFQSKDWKKIRTDLANAYLMLASDSQYYEFSLIKTLL